MIVSGLSLRTIVIVVGSVVALRTIQFFLNFRQLLRSIGYLPGYRTILDPTSPLGNIVPRTPLLALGHDHSWRVKHASFAARGIDIVSALSFWPKQVVNLFIADAQAIKDIVWSRGGFPKPVARYTVVNLFGRNIITSEGHEWKRYRKIIGPTFSERNNRMVWDAATRITLELFDTMWGGKGEIVVDHCVDLTLPIALSVIGAAGFGRPISWKDDAVIPHGHKLTLKDALHTTLRDLHLTLVVPRWAMKFTRRLRHATLACDELQKYLTEMIEERRGSQLGNENHDLFSSLLAANEDEILLKDEVKLSNSELIGNMFIIITAGHETTAHSLAFAFALLALYPDKQEKLYEHIKGVLPDGRIPTYDDVPSLTYASAVFNETLRMFPPTSVIPKLSTRNTTLNLTDVNGTTRMVDVPQGTGIILDVAGLHYNPKYWEDPCTFRPERFLGDWNRDAFLPFSSGYRACIGRKFTETEAIAVMTILISQYIISIKDEPQFAGESPEQRMTRVLAARTVLTLTPTRIPLVFRRRV